MKVFVLLLLASLLVAVYAQTADPAAGDGKLSLRTVHNYFGLSTAQAST